MISQKQHYKQGNLLGLAPVKYPAAFQLSTLPNSDVSLRKSVPIVEKHLT
jgi:hypothetical protein